MENSANTTPKHGVKGHDNTNKSSEEIDTSRYQQKPAILLLVGAVVVATLLLTAVEYLL